MPIPFSSDNTLTPEEELVGHLYSRLEIAYNAIVRAQSENNSDIYNSIVNIPSINKALQEVMADVQAFNNTGAVIALLSDKWPNISLADIQGFSDAFNSFSTDIEVNASLFLVSINATSKRTEFVTPVSTAIKTTITNRINAVLAEVG